MKNINLVLLICTILCIVQTIAYAIMGNIPAMFGFTSAGMLAGYLTFKDSGLIVRKRKHSIINGAIFRNFDWDAAADPDLNSPNFFNGTVTDKLMMADGQTISRLIGEKWRDEWNHEGEYINGVLAESKKIMGKPAKWTRGEALIAFTAFKVGENTGRLHEKSEAIIMQDVDQLNEFFQQMAEDRNKKAN